MKVATETLQPLYDQVIIRRESPEERTRGGLLLPESVRQDVAVLRGVVEAVGEGRIMRDGSLKPLAVKPGDVVIFPPNAGLPLEHEGELCVAVGEHQIVAIVEQAR